MASVWLLEEAPSTDQGSCPRPRSRYTSPGFSTSSLTRVIVHLFITTFLVCGGTSHRFNLHVPHGGGYWTSFHRLLSL